MKVVYSFLSLLLTVFIVSIFGILDIILFKDVVVQIFNLINRNIFDFNMLFLILGIVFLCSFVIIFLLYIRKNSKYIISSVLASAISVMFFTCFFGRFDIVKNFYFASNEFSQLVKNTLLNVSITNFSISLLLIIISIIYFIRRNKNEKES